MTSSLPRPTFPAQTPSYILSFQFQSWYPYFSAHSIKSTIIRPLSQDFRDYLDADGVFVPEGSDDAPAQSKLSDDEGDDDNEAGQDDDEIPPRRTFTFPELDKQIRASIEEYGAVFPKLNFSSPKDASWILPMSSPLKCTSPSDVYMLLKSSDFITHDLSSEHVFAGCIETRHEPYELVLVLRKWYPVDRGRELRCFVRGNNLIAISQRDTNYYEFLSELQTQHRVKFAVRQFWETHVRDSEYAQSIQDYVFDFLLTRDLSRGHIIDFNPYAPRTDPLLFTYEELANIHHLFLFKVADVCEETQTLRTQSDANSYFPELRVVDSWAHPAASSNMPAYQHNMIPFEALSLSSGKGIEEFAELWKHEIHESMQE